MPVRPKIFCFPYAGGSASGYLPWRKSLASTADVVPVELPGRGSRFHELPHDRLTPLLDDAMTAILPHLDEPIVLFGHSLGALLAFEVARIMRSRYRRLPVRLVVSGHRAPDLPMREPRIHYLPDKDFIARLRELAGTPEEVLGNDDLMRVLLPALRADFTVSERYRYVEDAPLNCPITVFGGIDDADIPFGDLQGWSRHTARRCRVCLFPGGHFFLHTAEPDLLLELGRELADTARTRMRQRV